MLSATSPELAPYPTHTLYGLDISMPLLRELSPLVDWTTRARTRLRVVALGVGDRPAHYTDPRLHKSKYARCTCSGSNLEA
jgi:hypothetical protein